MKNKAPRWPLVLGAAWLVAIAAGFRTIWRYEATPGLSNAAPGLWPQESAIARSRTGATMVMAAHPRCPCTKASVEELSVLMARLQGRMEAHVLFYQPADQPKDWSRTALWAAASAIPGVKAWSDVESVEARRFGAETSGQVVLYDAGGRLLFRGGITGLRGHVGDNAGLRAVDEAVGRGEPAARSTPVFGCALRGPTLTAETGHEKPIARN